MQFTGGKFQCVYTRPVNKGSRHIHRPLDEKLLPRVHRQAFHVFSVAWGTGACASFPYAFATLRVSLLAFSDHLPQSADSSRTPCRKKRRHLQNRRRNRDNISYSALLWAVFGIHAGFHDPLGGRYDYTAASFSCHRRKPCHLVCHFVRPFVFLNSRERKNRMYLFCAAGLIFPAAVAFVPASLKQRAYSGGNQICHTI